MMILFRSSEGSEPKIVLLLSEEKCESRFWYLESESETKRSEKVFAEKKPEVKVELHRSFVRAD